MKKDKRTLGNEGRQNNAYLKANQYLRLQSVSLPAAFLIKLDQSRMENRITKCKLLTFIHRFERYVCDVDLK